MLPYWIKNWQIHLIRKKHHLSGEGIRVALLDSGIDTAHQDLKNSIAETMDFCNPKDTAPDLDGHGTHLAGIIGARGNLQGMAPSMQFYIGRVMTHSWIVSDETVTEGINWAIKNNVDIISISCCFRYKDTNLHNAIKKASKNNILMVGSIGNKGESGEDAGAFPARFPEVMSVGSVNKKYMISNFTDKNSQLDILAPGENILSTYLNGTYKMISGTSQATAFMTGILSLLVELCKKKGITYDYTLINKAIRKTGKKCRFRNHNFLIIDPLAAIQYLINEQVYQSR